MYTTGDAQYQYNNALHSPFAIRFSEWQGQCIRLGECWASPVVHINMFNVLFQPAKKPEPNLKEKETTSGENQVQF